MPKQVSYFCGTGTKMKLWKFKDTVVCPLYNETEDNHLILRCKSNYTTDRWTESIASLEESIIGNHTP